MAADEEQRRILYPVDPASYRLLSEIGSGVSAVIYKALCIPLNSAVVAVKSIDLERSRANLDDVRRETKAMSLLSHPNILRAHCSFTVETRLWVVMPFMAAGSLHSIISSSFPSGLPEPAIAVVLKDTLNALSYLHREGHIHRDIKAGNILVDADGTVKLADFGVSASIYDSTHPSSGPSPTFSDVAGTPYWMAPEVIHSHVGYGVKADIWSFGITALELAHGRPPLSHLPLSESLMRRITSRLKLEDAHHHDDDNVKKPKKKFSKAFKDMVAACLSQDPSKRPAAEKLLRHPFFKNSRSPDYLVKAVLQAVPPVEERINIANHRPSSPEGTRRRRISGWNFNEDVLQLDPVYPLESGGGVKRRVGFCGEEVKGLGDVGIELPPPAIAKEVLVPNLVSLLGSLDVQRGMVMDVLACCGGGEEVVAGQREEELMGFVRSLERTVSDLSVQLRREVRRNAVLEEALENLRRKNNENEDGETGDKHRLS